MENYRYQIWIADDNPQYRELLKGHLERPDIQITCFDHSQELVTSLNSLPDIVILDHIYGDKAEGLNSLRAIKSRHPKLTTILISGQDDPRVAIEAIKSGASDYFEKDGNEIPAITTSVHKIIDLKKDNKESKIGTKWMKSIAAGAEAWRKIASILSLMLTLAFTLFQVPLACQGQTINLPEELTIPYSHIIQPDDKISLSIWNNEDLSIGSIFGIYNSNEVYGKWILVDENGEVSLPLLGSVFIAGLTTTQAAAQLQLAYSKDIKNPVVVVRVLNREITITGEVNEPGNVILDKEKTTLSEVLGNAQGFTDYARLKKVTLTRRDQDSIQVFPLDLKKMGAYDLSRIYVRRGDCIHIPDKAGKRIERKLPLLIPFASLMTGIGVLVSVSKNRSHP